MSGAREHILPFFIPMRGCSYRCVYCDQHSISGQEAAPSPREIEAAALAYVGPRPAQLAFYGGSFTALPREEQESYLMAARPALRRGLIDSLRVSTRPDAVSREHLEWLADCGVSTVELGIQSFDTAVLRASGRVYSPEQAERACLVVREAGLTLGIQLMSGLPEDSRAQSLRSMLRASELRPALMRIYPTLVLRGTPLAALYQSSAYQPQELAEAAIVAGDMLALAEEQGIRVIRLGLNPSPSLEAALMAGPYHPAFGQLARGALKLRQAQMLLDVAGQPALLRYPARERSLLFGQKNTQWQALQARYAGLRAEAVVDLPSGSLQAVLVNGDSALLTQDDFLRRYTKILRCAII